MNRKAYAKEFLTETIEAFVIILMFHVLSEMKLSSATMRRAVKFSVLVGGLSTLIFVMDEKSHEKIKDSMKNAVGASVMATALGVRR